MTAQEPDRVAAAARNKPITLGERQPVPRNPEWVKGAQPSKAGVAMSCRLACVKKYSRGLRKRTCRPEQTAQSAGTPSRAFPQCLAELRIQKNAKDSSTRNASDSLIFTAELCAQRLLRIPLLLGTSTRNPNHIHGGFSVFFVVRAPHEASRGSL